MGLLSLFTAPKGEEKIIPKETTPEYSLNPQLTLEPVRVPEQGEKAGCLGSCKTELSIPSVRTGDSDNPEDRVLCICHLLQSSWLNLRLTPCRNLNKQLQANQETASPLPGQGFCWKPPCNFPMAGGGNGLSGPSKPTLLGFQAIKAELQKGFVICQTQFGGMVASLWVVNTQTHTLYSRC